MWLSKCYNDHLAPLKSFIYQHPASQWSERVLLLSMSLQCVFQPCVVVSIVTHRLHPNLPGILMRPPTSNTCVSPEYWPLCPASPCWPLLFPYPHDLPLRHEAWHGTSHFQINAFWPCPPWTFKTNASKQGSPLPHPEATDQALQSIAAPTQTKCQQMPETLANIKLLASHQSTACHEPYMQI